jgi:hypothetical protein
MYDRIELGMLAVQALGLGGLAWYTAETRKMRLASQRQVEISQRLIDAAMLQVEGLSRPCLTLWSDLRDGADAILDMHGAVGTTKARADQGSFVAQNIGNGPALNISYQMIRIDNRDRRVNTRYIQNLLATQKVTMLETLGLYAGEVEVVFEYESIGGRKYRTTLDMNHHVLTMLRFEEIRTTIETGH